MCAVRGDIELPRNLDEIIAFVGEIIVDEPIPGWFFQLLDELHEVEASVTSSTVHLREFPSSEAAAIRFMTVQIAPLSYNQYHLAWNLPNNWIAIGDSVMRMNPIYG